MGLDASGDACSTGLFLYNTSIQGNKAISGGGMYLKGLSASFTKGTSITSNSARAIGGGVYLLGGHLSVKAGSTISNNSAPQGGAICWYSMCLEPELCPSSLAIAEGAAVVRNHASIAGGGVLMEGDLAVNYTGGVGAVRENFASLGDPDVLSSKISCDVVL